MITVLTVTRKTYLLPLLYTRVTDSSDYTY